VPVNGDRPHRFTELLPREESWTTACEAFGLGASAACRMALRYRDEPPNKLAGRLPSRLCWTSRPAVARIRVPIADRV
jgi:hypothetical protein